MYIYVLYIINVIHIMYDQPDKAILSHDGCFGLLSPSSNMSGSFKVILNHDLPTIVFVFLIVMHARFKLHFPASYY